ncbi:MAG TPA: GNAT family N-acetyltransferase [Ktedonobacterales bacterium]|nr:GNAT family N-acetyltransferase [Ktedonobacterales bacterium]
MDTVLPEWQVRDNTDEDEVQSLLEQDRIWNSFALADLLPPFREYSRFLTATHPGDKPSALLLIVQHPGFTTVSPFGDAAGVEAILKQTALPATALIQTSATHQALLERFYQPAPVWREMLRMAVTAQTFIPQYGDEQIACLTMDDLTEINDLYQLFLEAHFRPELLAQESFHGLRVNGRLRAIAGTHVVDEQHGIAVVGSVFTHPEARGRGYAGAVVSALVANLLNRGCRDVVLNVFATNTPAIAVYQRLGFQTRHHVWSGPAERRAEASS